ncbi:molecular chaperone DnaJ [Acetobacteraceae bacterium]|nr:molecular chaperone DnaJ [Acetobacteraceae bacterium]
MSQKRDYYEVLGITREVTITEIKRAYRLKARQYHPDLNPGDTQAEIHFKEVTEAYEILSDPAKRERYDRFGHEGVNQQGGGFGQGFGDLGDIFEQMFGGGQQRGGRRAQKVGEKIEASIHISLSEAFTGTEKKISIQRKRHCDSCDGTGSKDGASGIKNCSSCAGHGSVRMQNGFFVVERPCTTCRGDGQEVTNPCNQCNGSGLKEKTEEVDIPIPAGIDSGTSIRFSGLGHSAKGTTAQDGDLYVLIEIESDPRFQREDANLIMELPLRMGQAALGDTFEIDLIEGGKEKVEIMPGTQSGEIIRIRGKGFSILNSKRRGDLYLRTNVEIPKKLTKKQVELLEALEKEMGYEPKHPRPTPSLFEKTRKFFEGS